MDGILHCVAPGRDVSAVAILHAGDKNVTTQSLICVAILEDQ